MLVHTELSDKRAVHVTIRAHDEDALNVSFAVFLKGSMTGLRQQFNTDMSLQKIVEKLSYVIQKPA